MCKKVYYKQIRRGTSKNPHLSLAWETPQLRHLPDIKRSLTNVPTEQLPKPMTTPAHQKDHQTADYKMGNVQKVPRTNVHQRLQGRNRCKKETKLATELVPGLLLHESLNEQVYTVHNEDDKALTGVPRKLGKVHGLQITGNLVILATAIVCGRLWKGSSTFDDPRFRQKQIQQPWQVKQLFQRKKTQSLEKGPVASKELSQLWYAFVAGSLATSQQIVRGQLHNRAHQDVSPLEGTKQHCSLTATWDVPPGLLVKRAHPRAAKVNVGMECFKQGSAKRHGSGNRLGFSRELDHSP